VTPPVSVVVGAGRAGGSFAAALDAVGWDVSVLHHREVARPESLAGADLVLLCVPDAAVGEVAASMERGPDRVVSHCAGSLGLDVLGDHPRVGSVHPLVALPDPRVGAERLRGAWFAVSGDPLVGEVVAALGGRTVEVPDDRRAAYHAGAVVASNHLVALLGQVERIAAEAGVPLEAFLDLTASTLANVAELGPAEALTGPVSRGDWATLERHLEAIPPAEHDAYLAMAAAAATLAGRTLPPVGGGSVDP